ncbi:MAG TPA: type II TA system antitoxin MqsA family protein [Pirellulales bacterium]|nr:type II TA system antitoxin MqsA family protein [Pirellulales bacterium]
MKSTSKETRKRRRERSETVCGQCGSSALTVRSERENFTYGTGSKAKELSAVVPVYTCEKCGYQFTDHEAETALHEAVCKHLGVMTPRQVKDVRKRHGLSRAEFSRLTRLGTATLGRWERGALIQNPAYDQYLYLLRSKESVARLAERKWPDESAAESDRNTSGSPAECPDENTSARDLAVSHLSSRVEVVAQLEQLHRLVLDVCPDCLVKQRGDGRLIYVPPQREHATRNKNLLTMWAESAGVRMRIMPDREEMYDRSQETTYRQRLNRLYGRLIARTD